MTPTKVKKKETKKEDRRCGNAWRAFEMALRKSKEEGGKRLSLGAFEMAQKEKQKEKKRKKCRRGRKKERKKIGAKEKKGVRKGSDDIKVRRTKWK